MKLIVGLGNPGARYSATRHNIGSQVVEALGLAHGVIWQGRLPGVTYGEGAIEAQQVVLAKPLTYMNACGKAVLDLCEHFGLPPQDLIVTHDDLDLQLGRVRLKLHGGDAGHHGVQSIIEHLGTGEFARIRVGIGRPATKEEIVTFVLSPFTPDELPLVDTAVHLAVAKIELLLRGL